MSVPTNLIPTLITGLQEYTGSSTLGYMPYILDGRTYKVQFANIAAVGAVPSSRVIAAGTGLAGGGDLSANRVISIANGGVGFDQLALSGVTQGTYGSGSAIPILTVDSKGRITSATTAPLDVTGFVPTSRTITAGDGLTGGGALTSNVTLAANFSAATPSALGTASAGTAITVSRGDHVHPAVNLSDTSQTQGALPLGRGGTGDALSPVAGAVVYSTGSKFALTNPGVPGQVLVSAGTDEPQWQTIIGTGTVTSVAVNTANGFAGFVANPNTVAVITLQTTVTGLLKGDGTAVSAATAGVDYVEPGPYTTSGLTMASARLLGRTTASVGAAQEITVGTGLTLSGGSLVNAAPDQVVSLTGAGTTTVTGTYPSFTITSNDSTSGTVTSVNASGGTTGMSFTGGPVTSAGTLTLNGTLAVANGGTGATDAATALTNLGAYPASNPAGYTTNVGTVTSVSGTGTVSGLSLSGTVTSAGSLTLGGTLAVLPSNFASQTANTVLAAPNGSAGVPTFRSLVAADVPTLNQNTTGTASNVTGIVAVANGGTGASVAGTARTNLGAAASGANTDITSIALTTGTISATPVNGTDIVNKTYADSIASGINFHQSVRLATTAALPANTYNNGTSGVGATLTANANGALTVDGVAAVAGNRILVKNEATQANNGVYTVTQVGTGSTPYILTRATDFDSSGSGVDQIDAGDFFLVTAGSTLANTSWVQQTPLPITVGTTAIVFSQFAAPVLYSAGTGLSLTGTTFSITNTGVSASTYGSASSVPVIAVNAQGQITSASASSIAIAASQITSGALAIANGGTGATSAATALTNLGAYPASNPSGFTSNTGTVTSVNLTAGTGVSVSGGPITASGSITVTNTAPDQVVSLTGSGATTVTGTYPNFTISSTAGGSGTVTSINVSGGTTGLTTSGGPVTSSGTITLAGTLNVANGGTGATTLSSGYLLKGNGTSAVSASVVYDNGTNVGIGTSSPTFKLQVAGTLYTSSNVQFYDQDGFRFASSAAYTSLRMGSAYTGESTGELAYDRTNGALTYKQGNTGSALTERMRITSAGFVGVGTGTPGAQFENVGQTRLGANVAQAAPSSTDILSTAHTVMSGNGGNYLTIGQYPGAQSFAQWIQSSFSNPTTATYNLVLQPLGGNVGVGTNSPASKLNVSGGNVTISAGYGIAWSGDQTRIMTPEDNVIGALINWGAGGGCRFISGTSERMRIDGGGQVGIGTSSPFTTLDVSGTGVGGTGWVGRFGNTSSVGVLLGVRGGVASVGTQGAANLSLNPDGGNVGIGEAAPGSALQVNGNIRVSNGTTFPTGNSLIRSIQARSGSANQFTSSSIDFYTAAFTDNGQIAFSTGLSERARIDGDGTLKLSVGGVVNTHQFLYNESGGEIQLIDSTGAGPILLDNSGGLARFLKVGSGSMAIGTTSTGFLRFQTVDTERMRVGSDGNVAIGTTSTGSARLTVTGGNGIVVNGSGAAGYNVAQFINDNAITLSVGVSGSTAGGWTTNLAHLGTVTNSPLVFGTNSSERMRIASGGFVGIGTSSPGEKLDVVSTSSHNIVVSRSTTSYAAFQRFAPAGQQVYDFYNINGVEAGRITVNEANFMAFATGSSATERMRIDSTGNVAIGTSTAANRLTVSATGLDISGGIAINGTNMQGIRLQNTLNDNSSLGLWFGTNNVHWSGISGQRTNFSGDWTTDLRFYTHEAALVDITYARERMRIDGPGNVGIGTTSFVGKLNVSMGDATSSGAPGAWDNTYALFGGTTATAGAVAIGYNSSSGGSISALSAGVAWRTMSYQANIHRFLINGGEKMRVASDGNVGIGNSIPGAYGARLAIGDPGDAFSNKILTLTQYATYTIEANGVTPAAGTTFDWSWANGGQGPLKFSSSGTERMRLTASGNVSIGAAAIDVSALSISRNSSTASVAATSSIVLSNRNTGLNGTIAGGIFVDTYRDVRDPHYSGGIWFTRNQEVSNLSSSSDIVFGAMTSWDSGLPTERMRINAAGNVGIGTNSPSFKLDVQGSSAQTARVYCTDSGSGSYAAFNASSANGVSSVMYSYVGAGWYGTTSNHPMLFLSNNTERARFNTSGEFLTGTTVGGRSVCMYASDMWLRLSNASRQWLIGPSNGTSFRIWDETGGASRLEIDATGSTILTGLLVGRNSASTDVNSANDTGSISVRGSTTTVASMSFHRAGAYAINMGLGTDNVFRIGGWSASSNAFQMDGSGNLTMLGNVTAYSDARMKKDVVTIDNALDLVGKMRGVRYTRIDTEKRGTGVIAQEMLEVMPEVVQQGIGGDDTLSVAYGNLVGVLIEAVKELTARVAQLEGK